MAPLVQPPSATPATLGETYPNYLIEAHVGFLLGATGFDASDLSSTGAGTNPYNAVAFTQQAVDENPYSAAEALDPSDILDSNQEALGEFSDLIDTYLSSAPNTTGEQQTMDDFITKAAALYDTHSIDIDTDINAQVAEFETASEDEYLRQRSAFEVGMFSINAIETSPYIMGLALKRNERIRSLAAHRSKLIAMAKRDKNVFVVQLAELMSNLQGRNAGLVQAVAAMQSDFARFEYTSRREFEMQNIEYDVGEVEWELEALKSGTSIIGAMQGMPLSQKKPSNLATAVSTALSIGPQVGISLGQATRNPVIGVAGGILASLFAYNSNING